MKRNTLHPLTYLVWRTVRDAGSITSDAVVEQLYRLSEKRVRNNLYNLVYGGFLCTEDALRGGTKLFSLGRNQPRHIEFLEEELAKHPVYLGLERDTGSDKPPREKTSNPAPARALANASAGQIVQPRRPDITRTWHEPYMAVPVRAGSLDFARCASVRAGGRLVHCYDAVTATTAGDTRK